MGVLTRPIDAGVLVALSGTLDSEQQVDALTHGLACLSADGVLIVDVSGVLLGAARLFARLADNLGDQIAAGNVRVVATGPTARLLLGRGGVRPVPPHAADEIAAVT